MHASIQALLFNLHRYPMDKPTIYQCIKGLGDNPQHTPYIEFLSDHLLRLDRYVIQCSMAHNSLKSLRLITSIVCFVIVALHPPSLRSMTHSMSPC